MWQYAYYISAAINVATFSNFIKQQEECIIIENELATIAPIFNDAATTINNSCKNKNTLLISKNNSEFINNKNLIIPQQ